MSATEKPTLADDATGAVMSNVRPHIAAKTVQ
jgi:hypothetical protein